MISTFCLKGLEIQTGDILCTTSGGEPLQPGQFWRLLGSLVPGEVDHVAVYVGPGGRCVEAALKGVAIFDLPDEHWSTDQMSEQRGNFVDRLVGIAYPLTGRGLSLDDQNHIREAVGTYCLAQVGKPYNLNFLDSEAEWGFYCSQLPYKAYKRCGIDLNTGQEVPNLPGTRSIIFPQEIWSGCSHKRVE